MAAEAQEISQSPEESLSYIYHGNPHALQSFVHRANCVALGLQEEADRYDTRLIFGPGGQAGANCIGAALVVGAKRMLHDGSTKRAYGISAGAITLAYLAAEMLDAHTIVDKENVKNRFIHWANLFVYGKPVNWQSFEQVIRESFPLSKEALASCPIELWIAVSPIEGKYAGKTHWIDLRKYSDPAALILASSRIPVVGNMGPVYIDIEGTMTACVDGAYAGGWLQDAISGATDAICFMNEKLPSINPHPARRIVQDTAAKIGDRIHHPIIQPFLQSGKREREEAKDIWEMLLDTRARKLRIGAFIPREDIGIYCMNPQRLRQAKSGAQEAVLLSFEQHLQCRLD